MNKNAVIWIVVLVVILGGAAIAYSVMNNSTSQTAGENPLTQTATVTPSTSGTNGMQNTGTTQKAGTKLPPAQTPTAPKATKPTLALVSPASGAVGDEIVLHGSGFNSTSRVILGSGVVSHVTVNSAGTEVTFTVPNGVGAYCKAGQACPMYLMLLQPGAYDIAVENDDGSRTGALRFQLLAKTNAI